MGDLRRITSRADDALSFFDEALDSLNKSLIYFADSGSIGSKGVVYAELAHLNMMIRKKQDAEISLLNYNAIRNMDPRPIQPSSIEELQPLVEEVQKYLASEKK